MRNPPDHYLSALEKHFSVAPVFANDAALGWDIDALDNASTPVTTNQAAQDTAFQRWFHFKEAFSPTFVTTAIQMLGFRPDHVIDPFGGSGTTAITCQLMGINATTIEVNPFLADVIRAKTSNIPAESLIEAAARFRRSLAQTKADLTVLDHLPPTFLETPEKSRWIFPISVALRLSQYLKCIYQIACPDIRRFFRVALGAVLVECSNVYINGKGRRYRRSWEETQATAEMLDFRFHEQFNRAFEDVLRFAERPKASASVLQGDARSVMRGIDMPADLIVFSPPYPNSFDYTDIYNVELWMLGYLTSSQDNAFLRHSTLHSHVQIQRIGGAPKHPSGELDTVVAELRAKRDELWDNRIPEMVQGYFQDLEGILLESYRLLSTRGKVMMVVGDSRYAGTLINVPRIVTELSNSIGYKHAQVIEVRKMRASAQQGGNHHLRECIIELSK